MPLFFFFLTYLQMSPAKSKYSISHRHLWSDVSIRPHQIPPPFSSSRWRLTTGPWPLLWKLKRKETGSWRGRLWTFRNKWRVCALSWPQRSTCTENWLVYCFSIVILVIVLLVHEYKDMTCTFYIQVHFEKNWISWKSSFFCDKTLKVKLVSFRVLNA